jgi:hypothetical protein
MKGISTRENSQNQEIACVGVHVTAEARLENTYFSFHTYVLNVYPYAVKSYFLYAELKKIYEPTWVRSPLTVNLRFKSKELNNPVSS